MIRRSNSQSSNIDWMLVTLYLILVVMGWLTIWSATTNSVTSTISNKGLMQGVWVIISLLGALAIMKIDPRYFFSLAFPFYWIMVFVLLLTIFLGTEINGAKSWLVIGPMRVQPAELGKLATALAVARLMKDYRFNIKKIDSLFRLSFIIGLPTLIILLQNDTGSALVYFSFLFMLYHEGLSQWVYFSVFGLLLLFITTFFITPIVLSSTILILTIIATSIYYRNWKIGLRYIVILYTIYGILVWAFRFYLVDVDPANLLLYLFGASVPVLLFYSYRNRLSKLNISITVVALSFLFFFIGDYMFENVMQIHQQKRILDLLGIESDVAGWGYNVNQSNIAIGSGGLLGKGFMEATQTKYNFVPEHSTDFIFCTVGEEFGFIGAVVVLSVFAMFIVRLMLMAYKQTDTFRRVYTLSVASVFLFHLFINVGMTIGLTPVIGIPLPFFSYGGSSLLSFTLLTFIAIRINSDNR
ncbi:MAG: rod shape-determining protein RodA [Rikenellaceae bacterium]